MQSRGEVPLSTLVWQPRPSAWVMTVAAKLSFVLEPGTASLAPEQEPIHESDSHWDDDEQRSLSVASDLAPTKPRVDVLLVGHAFAPKGQPQRGLIATLGVEGLQKSIELYADRSLGPDGRLYEGSPFTRMRLVYERAAHGSTNPAGVRSAARDSYGRSLFPNLVPVGSSKEEPEAIDPVGFGPIAPTWSPRRERLGRHAAHFAGTAWQSQPLPEGFDLGYFNLAPSDQQLDSLPADARIYLENLHKSHAELRSRLPGAKPKVTASRRGTKQAVVLRADTLWIDTDRGICTVTWRGQIPLDAPDERVALSVELEEPRPSWKTAQTELARETITSEALTDRSQPPGGPRGTTRGNAVLPFSALAARAQEKTSSEASGPATRAFSLESLQAAQALPFASRSASSPPGAGDPRFANEPSWGGASATPFSPPQAPPKLSQPATTPPPPVASVPPAPPVAASQAPPPPPPNAYAPASPSVPPAAALGGSVAAAYVAAAKASQASAGPWPSPGAAIAPPAPVALQHASTAALAGVVGASNAAADPRARASAGPVVQPFQGDVLQLLWFDPEAAPRIRRRPEWKKILDQLEAQPPDPELDEPALSDEHAELEDRREVFEILARGTPSGEDGVESALYAAVRSDGRFAPQLLLLAGEARFDFDEVEMLKAVLSAATPFVVPAPAAEPQGGGAPPADELKLAVDQALAYLGTPDLVPSADLATTLTTKIREAFAKSSRSVGPTYLDDQAERALLERRAYQKRSVFGAPHLRALFYFAGGSTGVPTYFPEALAKKLPLFRRLRVKLLAEAHFQADQYESHPSAVRAAAVARVLR